MSLQAVIESKIQTAFQVKYLAIENESHMHSGSAVESHFKMTLVANEFEGMSKVKRHQAVYKALAEEMPKFHALALHTFSPTEWQETPSVADSPLCQGGGK
ncbi:BolA family protein [Hydrogenovibrio kuenenii]|uniref:BolA family protein n=1 Tax=Hydrogenovibrio kuenenii TaxID=63658 RepID=UPI000466E4CD|nr:BolA family protein [Hydrogenovibrio kuenenii]